VVTSAKNELLSSEPTTNSKPPSPAKSVTVARRRSSGANIALRTRAAHRRSSGNLEEEMEPEHYLAHSLGLSLPADGASDSERVEVLESILFDRIGRLEGHATNLQTSTENSIASHLVDAHLTLELLHDSLLAQSLYGKVHLVEPSIETSIANLEQEIQSIQESLDGVDLHSLQSKNVRRDQFVQRWSR
jgi:hypothetical protein